MKKHKLTAATRTQFVKTVKVLRKQGQLPGTVYGKALQSISILAKTDEFLSVYKEAGEAGLIELTIDGKVHPVLIHTVQVHAVTGALLHVEFHQVNLKEKIHAKVSVEQTGESPAAAQKLGVVLTIHDAIDVEVREDHVELFAKAMEKIMILCGNKYVKQVQMEVDTTITDFWTK